MRYLFYDDHGSIGWSDLEKSDPTMGIRHGRFCPEEGYLKLQPSFREWSRLSFPRQEDAYIDTRLAELRQEITSFRIRLETTDERLIPTIWIQIDDYSEELGEDGLEVTIAVSDYRVYAEFFEEAQ